MIKKAILLSALLCACAAAPAQDMKEMWGTQDAPAATKATTREAHLFEWGNYAMFIHWGLYSQLANQWKGKTYYGIGEWLMSKSMAGIPLADYEAVARSFNPQGFDAKAIAQLAKDAGMKYIIITSKHHEGFAMYDSKACDFNIVKQTPFGRDPMKELAQACRDLGLGFGFYYSHNQDWTYPGGNGGPTTDAQGNPKTFDDYFKEKCLPQVEEITRNYGDIELVWFDTPGGMPKKYAEQLVETVHRNQPHALVSGRVGYNLGDYQTLGDMEVPLENVDGLWESVDVTNDSWGYAWYDQNWKSPKLVLSNLIATVGRGGTYMMNVGPGPDGRIPAPAQATLRAAGKWIARHPYTVYGAGASPWRHALAWGDATTNGGHIYLSVFDWPVSGQLHVPGVLSKVARVELMGDKKGKKLKFKQEDGRLTVAVPMPAPDALAAVLKVTPAATDSFRVDPTQAVDPEFGLTASVKFAKATGGNVRKRQWMEKFGEWKTAYAVNNWTDKTAVTWEVDIPAAGYYQIGLSYLGATRMVWRVEDETGAFVQNQQGATSAYALYPIGWLSFSRPGKHRLTVRAIEGDLAKASLTALVIKPVGL